MAGVRRLPAAAVLMCLVVVVAPVAPVVATAPPAPGGTGAGGYAAAAAAWGAVQASAQANGTNDSDGWVAGDWPMGGADPRRTRVAPGAGLLRDPAEVANFSAERGVFAAPAVGDVDGDGGNEIVYVSNNGTVRAADPDTDAVLWSAEMREGRHHGAPAIADIDGDDGAEVIAGGEELHAFDGATGQREWNTSVERGTFYDAAPVAADIDDDGVVEVVSNGKELQFGAGVVAVDGRDGSIEWHLRSGAGQTAPALADLDGDPATEVVVGLVNEGSLTTFDDARVASIDGATGNVTWVFRAPDDADTTSAPTLADTDGDGAREVLFTVDEVESGGVYALSANGSVEWNATAPLRDGGTTPWAPAAGDVDGDGGADVVVNGKTQNFALDGADGASLWTVPDDDLRGEGLSPSAARPPTLADADGDGATEAVIGAQRSDAVFTLDGATGVPEWRVPMGSVSLNNLRTEPVVADVDGDGLLEVVGGAGFHDQPSGVFVLDHRGGPPTNGNLTVRRATPRVVRDPGEATLTVVGSGLSDASLSLVSPAGERFEPLLSGGGSRSLRGRFDIPRTVGVWNLTVRKGEEVRRFPVFVAPRGPLVDLRDAWPSQTVPGRPTEVGLSVRNRGVDDGVAVVAVQFPQYVTVEGVEPGRSGTVLVNESHRVVLAQPVPGDGGSASAAVQYRLQPDAVAFPGTNGSRPVELDRRTSLGTAIHLGTLTRAGWRDVRDESPLDVQIRAMNATNHRLIRAGSQLNATDSGRDLVRVLNASHERPAGEYVGLLLTRTSETMWSLYAGWNRSRAGVAPAEARRAYWPARGAAAPRHPRYGRGLPPAELRAGLQSDRDCWQELGKGAFNAAATYTGAPVSFTDEGVSATLPTPVVPVSAEVTGPGSEGGAGVDLSGPSVSDAPGMVQEGSRRLSRRAARRAGDYAQYSRGLDSQYFRQRTAQAADRGAKYAKVARKAGKVAKLVAAFNSGWEIGEGIRKYINCRLKEEGLDTTYSELMGEGIYDSYPDAVDALADGTIYAERKWNQVEDWWWDAVGADDEDGDGSEVVASIDPNDIQVKPEGVGAGDYVASDRRLTYRVRFENLANASAAARDVTVTVPVDRSLDYDSIETVASSHPDVLAVSRNPDARTVTWTFSGIDLPPNENPPEGEGYVEFTARPSPNVTLARAANASRAANATGAANATVDRTIVANATIQFEANPPIETNVLTQRVDATPPETRIASLDRVQPRNFTVAWNGSDTGAGLAGGRLLVARADNDSYRAVGVLNVSRGANATLRTNTTANATNATANATNTTANATSATVTRNGTIRVTGEPGVTYRLVTVGVDRLGNVERLPGEADATVTVNTAPTADPRATGAATAGESVSFEAGASDEVGEVAAVRWQFGDGETATGPSPSHTYAEPGTYDVTVVVEDDLGATTNASFTVEVGQAETPGGTATRTVARSPGDEGGGFALGPLAVGGAVALVVIAGGALFAIRRFGG